MSARLRLIGTAVLAVILAAPVLRAWVPLAINLWPDGPVPVAFEIASTAPRGLAGDWDEVAREAVAAWNLHLQRVQLVVTPPSGEPWYENRRNEVFFDRQLFGRAFPSGVLAVAYSSYDRDERVETEVVISSSYTWSVYHGPLQRGIHDVRRVVIHELGHLLGLDHPDEAGQTVSAVMNSHESDTETPTPDDSNGAHALYDFGAGTAPVIRTQPVGRELVQGATGSVFVTAGGRGPLTYEWQRDGVTVASSGSDTLEFRAAELSDAGEYVVVVRNEAGSARSNPARITVRTARPPVVGPLPNNWSSVGQTVTFAAAPQGDAPFRYLWSQNGVVIPGATRARLTLTDVQFSQAGEYEVTVVNAAGSAKGAGMLFVSPPAPPRIYQQPQSGAVAPRASFFLEVRATGSEPFTYQWQRNGTNIPGGNGATLEVRDFGPAQAGSYTVIITNALATVTSEPAVIAAYQPATITFLRQPASVREYPGGTATLEAVVSPSAATYRWFKDGAPLLPGTAGRITGMSTPTLTVSGIEAGDLGAYALEVTVAGQAARSKEAFLSLRAPPAPLIVRQPATHTVPVGSAVLKEVAVYVADRARLPSVSYQWFKDGTPVEGQTSAAYAFTAAAATAGRYTVRVTSNDVVVDSEPADVEITDGPRLISVHPASEVFEPNSEQVRLVIFGAEVARRRGEAQGVVTVYRRGEQALAGSPYELGDRLPGTYTMTLTFNGRSETSRPFTLGYRDSRQPIFLRHPAGATVALGSPLALSVSIASPSPVTYMWSKDGAPLFNTKGDNLLIPALTEADAGSYSVSVFSEDGRATSESAVVEILGAQAPVILNHPVSRTITGGQRTEFVVLTRPGSFRFQWYKDGRAIPNATADRYAVPGWSSDAGAYTVFVTDGSVSATSRSATLAIRDQPRPPTILKQPTSATAPVGGEVAFSASADGEPLPGNYQWRKDGVAIPGATDSTLRLRGVQSTAAGDYSVVISNGAGSVASQVATLSVDPRGRLVNLATRAAVGRGSNLLIAGFVLAGTEPRTLLIRAIGDQLSEFGVTDVLRDPVVTVLDAKGATVATNDDWSRGSADEKADLLAAARDAGAFPQRDSARDAAVLVTLAPGSYTAQVTGFYSTYGVALVEVYEVGLPRAGRLINLSSRAVVGAGANILIPGIVIRGQTPQRLLIRAVGPGLAGFGVAGALTDPVMTVFDGAGKVVADNDNWSDQANPARIVTATTSVGAFGLTSGSRDAALVLDLAPGTYTVQVAGVRDATGIALVEVYEVAP